MDKSRIKTVEYTNQQVVLYIGVSPRIILHQIFFSTDSDFSWEIAAMITVDRENHERM